MWADNETTDDLLGFRVHADLIHEMVCDADLLPLTVGVFADWGGGKSSVLRMLEERLNSSNGKDGRFCLYVNGWLFEGYDDAKAALMTAILSQLAAHPTLGKSIRDKLLPLIKSVDCMRAIRWLLKGTASAALLTTLGIEPNTALAVLGGIASVCAPNDRKKEDTGNTEPSPDDVVAISEFRECFADALKESKVETLVILVDDLDRCSPSRIIENLEAMKLFLNVKRTAFVIGADPRIVRHAIRLHYRGLSGGSRIDDEEQIVKDYLEKLIHVPFGLPRLSVPEVQNYMSMLFCAYRLDEDQFAKCKSTFVDHVAADRYSAISKDLLLAAIGSNPPPTIDRSLAFCTTASPLVGEGLKGNPRLVKRFLNTYVVREKLADVAHLEIDPAILVKLMVLEYGHPDAYRELYDFVRQSDGLPPQLGEWEACASEEGDSVSVNCSWRRDDTFLHRWTRMKPGLSGEDLRDYFWLSRDRLDGTLGEIRLLPPYLKRLVNGLAAADSASREATADDLVSQTDEDRERVLAEVGKLMVATPGRMEVTIGLIECVLRGVKGAESALASAIERSDHEKLAPAVGYRLVDLRGKTKNAALIACFDALATSDSAIGKVMSAAAKKRTRK